MIPFVDLKAQYAAIAPEIDTVFHDVTASADYILGARVKRFEEEFARYVETAYAVGVGNGLDALRLGLLALGVGPGDEVILPANTYIATALAVSEIGADVVLVDCDAQTPNIETAAAAAAVTHRTKAVLPVHLTGQAVELQPLIDVAERNGIALVEDAAQAHGARWNGRPCGSVGTIGCYSFYPGKNLGAYGDAGLTTTNDTAIAERLRRLRNYGERSKYDHVVKGVNSRLDALQASFLSVKLPHLDSWNAARIRHAHAYASALDGVGDVVLPRITDDGSHVYHLFAIRTASRDALRDFLMERGIQTGIHYPIPIHLQEAYADLGLGADAFPNAEALAHETLSLPMFPELTLAQIDTVVAAIRAFFDSGDGC